MALKQKKHLKGGMMKLITRRQNLLQVRIYVSNYFKTLPFNISLYIFYCGNLKKKQQKNNDKNYYFISSVNPTFIWFSFPSTFAKEIFPR